MPKHTQALPSTPKHTQAPPSIPKHAHTYLLNNKKLVFTKRLTKKKKKEEESSLKIRLKQLRRITIFIFASYN